MSLYFFADLTNTC